MSDRELLEKASKALKVFYKLAPAPTLEDLLIEVEERAAELRDIEKRREKRAIAINQQKQKGVNNGQYSQELTARYEQAKALRAAGLKIDEACAKANITRDQWYRRKNIDRFGQSRRKKQ